MSAKVISQGLLLLFPDIISVLPNFHNRFISLFLLKMFRHQNIRFQYLCLNGMDNIVNYDLSNDLAVTSKPFIRPCTLILFYTTMASMQLKVLIFTK